MNLHTGETPYHCSYCDESFPKKERLKHHRKKYHTGFPHKCPVCPRSMVSLQNLSDHIRAVHSNQEKPYHCESCPKKFSYLAHLKSHSRIHTESNTMYDCKIC